MLRAYVLVYDRYFGRGAHRRLSAFQDVLSQLREVRKVKEIKERDYGGDGEITAWFDSALKARRPRAPGKADPAAREDAAAGAERARPCRRRAAPVETMSLVRS